MKPKSGGLLLLRRNTPLPRRAVAYFCSGAHRFYQLLNAIVHIPYPESVLYSNKTHVIYHAYKIGGMWRLNSTFNEASQMAGFLIVGMTLLGWKMMTQSFKIGTACSFGLMLAALLMTLSSTGYATLALLVLVGGLLYARYLFRGGAISHGHVIVGALIVVSTVALFSLSSTAIQTVNRTVTSTLLEKKNSDSYKARRESDIAAIETLSKTYYMGAGWGSARASGLFYSLLGNIGIPGVAFFLVFVGSLFLPLFHRPRGSLATATGDWDTGARSIMPIPPDSFGQALFAMIIMLAALTVAGSELDDPMLWVLFGVATVGPRPLKTGIGPDASRWHQRPSNRTHAPA